MRNFSGIVAWYSADRIGGMLAWSSNISIIFIVNSKIALVFETEMLNWTANEESLQRVGRFFIQSRFCGFGSDFVRDVSWTLRICYKHAPAIFHNLLSSYEVIAFILMRFSTVSTVHINTICIRFRLHPLSRAFANRCVFDENARCSAYECGRALVTTRELHISYKLNLSGGKNFCFLIRILPNLKAWGWLK